MAPTGNSRRLLPRVGLFPTACCHEGAALYRLDRQGVNLSFDDRGKGAPPLLFIHDLACDHTAFAPQLDYFRSGHRVVAVDLRGHGESDKPDQEYTIAGFADDVAWICYELGVYSPVLCGHGLGGLIAVELASRHPELPAALVVLDSPLASSLETAGFLRSLGEQLRSPCFSEILKNVIAGLFSVRTDRSHRDRMIKAASIVSQRTAVTTVADFLAWDVAAGAAACRVPMLYVDAGVQATNLDQLRQTIPDSTVERIEGAGHFLQLHAPNWTNQTIERFLRRLRD